MVPDELKLKALLHDAGEAYLVDIPSPIKHLDCMAGYRSIEDNLQRSIYELFGVDPGESQEIDDADKEACRQEGLSMIKGWCDLPPCNQPRRRLLAPFGFWSPEVATKNYMSRFERINR